MVKESRDGEPCAMSSCHSRSKSASLASLTKKQVNVRTVACSHCMAKVSVLTAQDKKQSHRASGSPALLAARRGCGHSEICLAIPHTRLALGWLKMGEPMASRPSPVRCGSLQSYVGVRALRPAFLLICTDAGMTAKGDHPPPCGSMVSAVAYTPGSQLD
jgi:hypothetical protein